MPSHNQGYAVSIDGVASSTIPEFLCQVVNRRLVGSRRHTVEEVPGLPGGWLFPEAPGMREITLECAVIADSYPLDRRGAIREVANWVDKSGFVKMVISDEPDVFNWVTLRDAPDIDEWREVGLFELPFLALPYAFTTAIQSHNEVAVTSAKTFNVEVNGDVEVRPVITISGTAGANSVAEVTIGDDTLTHTATLAGGVIRNINCLARVVEDTANGDPDVDGSFDVANLSMAGVSGTFPKLQPGTNSVTITLTGTGSWTADITWRDMYR